jgi:hypothetical protein
VVWYVYDGYSEVNTWRRLANGCDKVRRRVHIVKRLLRILELTKRFSIPLFVYYTCLCFICVYDVGFDEDCFTPFNI